MKIKIKMHCDNSAFEPDPGEEVARILRQIADTCVEEPFVVDEWAVADANGNTVCWVRVTE